MECLEPSEHAGEDITPENVCYCNLDPECGETDQTPTEVGRPADRFWTRVRKWISGKLRD